MIEFWPDCCGYKLQVEDTEAGKWIHCPYCNARIQVPDSGASDDPFAEALSELPDEFSTPESTTQISGPAFGKRGTGFDPMQIAIKAVLVVIFVLLGVVAFRQGSALLQEWNARAKRQKEMQQNSQAGSGQPQQANKPKPQNVLQDLPGGRSGVYVDSYPTGLQIYVHQIQIPEDDDPTLVNLDSLQLKGETPCRIELERGDYLVFVTCRVNSVDLMKLPGYPEVRRDLESTGKVNAAAEYFLVDGAIRLLYQGRTGRFGLLAKVYRVTIQPGTWVTLSSFFLPRADGVELLALLPEEIRYNVDEAVARQEMDYRMVPAEAQGRMLEILRRRGRAIRAEGDGVWRVFQVTPYGLFSPAFEAVSPGEWKEIGQGR